MKFSIAVSAMVPVGISNRTGHVMNISWSPLKFVLEEADEARLHGDNYKAEALINIAYDILDRQHNIRRDRTAVSSILE